MAKLSREDFTKKYSERITDNDDLLIELLEDISDSIEDNTDEVKEISDQLEKVERDYADLKEKYKTRFLDKIDNEIEEVKQEDSEELTEEEVIDIKEI